MTGHACPDCGGRRPGCACARAADRSAELAAAEDFDPLRIRPYVTLDAHDEAGDPPTTQLRAVQATAGADAGPYGGAGAHGGVGTHGGAAGPYEPVGVGEAGAYEARTQAIPAYGTEPSGYGPEAYGSEAYGSGGGAHETMPLLLGGTDGSGPGGGRERPGRRRSALVAVVAAAAVVGTAALAAAVLGGEDPDDRALVPEVTTSASLNLAVSEEPSPSSSSPKADRTPSRTPSPTTSSPTATPSTASPSATTATTGPTRGPTATGSPSATGGAAPSASGSTAPATSAAPPTAPTSPPRTDAPAGAVLRVGDTGPEVQDLQRRLRYLWVYLGEIDGVYGDEVRAAVASFQGRLWPPVDEPGVYDADTRRKLERETRGMND
ncbi:peptidoglycan-binding protein [Streptomyces sp. NE5-10]|uniref:peptidoglycan-binding domain-containing protein n=1 Tax=Streptomyces sp. NE5-10 TaxID=2759674 RepID=UPI001906296D|nr:peptidoglycan-binding domain-containing protein [Streptomyces sp. NE5-10]